MPRSACRFLLLLALAGCAGGGGGGRTPEATPTASPSVAAEIPARLNADLAGEDRDYTEAYARTPWIHANVAAGAWDQAQADLDFVRERLQDLLDDPDVPPALKAKFKALTPTLDALGRQIAGRQPAAIATSARLVERFVALTSEPVVVAWVKAATGGGGGGGRPRRSARPSHRP